MVDWDEQPLERRNNHQYWAAWSVMASAVILALLLPIAYTMKLPPESTMILLAAVYYGAEYGGRITSILINVPGDAGAV